MATLHIGLLLAACALSVSAMDQLSIVYEWKQLDFQYPTEEARGRAKISGEFIPENNLPMGLEVYGDRLFITVPRWKRGVPSTLNYIDLKDKSTTSPKLNPYPNWAAHRMDNSSQSTDLVSPFRVRADRCGRLWVLDSGKTDILGNSPPTFTTPPALIVYDLRTDSLLRKYTLPDAQVKEDSFFANIAVEDFDCDDSFAYLADVLKPGLVVYSWAQNDSWRVKHHYFHPDPLACDFNVRGLNFTWQDGVFGLGLSAPRPDNFSTLYFHPLASYDEFAVSTGVLRNRTLAEGDTAFHEFALLGSRGPNAQSSVSFVDPATGVLFYSLVNLNAVACWRTSNREYGLKSQGRIYMSDVSMVYPSDIKVDNERNLWVLSNRMPLFMYGALDVNEVNFRVFSAPVVQAISHTACDVTPRVDILDKFVKGQATPSQPSAAPPLTTAVAALALTAAAVTLLPRL